MELLSHTQRQLPTEGTLVVAVSGGRDSMTLLRVLLALETGPRLVVAHCNHGLRGAGSDADARLVKQTAHLFALPYFELRGAGLATDELSLREERWRFLESVADEVGASTIATAHHAADQLETVLMRLLRGTGPRGLAGIRAREGRRWRPWLSVPPETIAAWADAHGVLWRNDPSNATSAYTRNSVRHAILPALFQEAERHGGAGAFLQRLAATCEATGRLVDAAALAAVASLHATTTPFFFRYRSEHAAQDDATLDALAVHLGAPLLRAQRTRALQATGASATWGNGLEWTRSCDFDYVTTPEMRRRAFAWQRETDIALSSGANATPKPLEWRTSQRNDGIWRRPKPGDRFGRHKLKDHWLRTRVPRPERSLQIVFAQENCVIWAAGAEASFAAQHDGFPFARNP